MGKRTEWLLNGATAVMALCALLLVGLRVKDLLKEDPLKPHRIADAASFARAGHRMGPADAAVTIVEFADYQCPYCQQAEGVLAAIRERYGDQVSIVYRHFPLFIHDSAVAAAHASECAATMGDFERFHHFLFANAKAIGREPWQWFAHGAGVADLAGFERCIETQAEFPAIQEDRAAAERLGIESTPIFLINDLQVSGYLPFPEFDSHVRNELDHSRARGR